MSACRPVYEGGNRISCDFQFCDCKNKIGVLHDVLDVDVVQCAGVVHACCPAMLLQRAMSLMRQMKAFIFVQLYSCFLFVRNLASDCIQQLIQRMAGDTSSSNSDNGLLPQVFVVKTTQAMDMETRRQPELASGHCILCMQR